MFPPFPLQIAPGVTPIGWGETIKFPATVYGQKKAGTIENRPGPNSVKGNYLVVPIEAGIGAGFGLLAHAPKLSVAAAKTANAAILTNFMKYFPLLSALVATRD